MQHIDVHRLYMIVPSPGMARGTVRTKVGALILVQFIMVDGVVSLNMFEPTMQLGGEYAYWLVVWNMF